MKPVKISLFLSKSYWNGWRNSMMYIFQIPHSSINFNGDKSMKTDMQRKKKENFQRYTMPS